MSLTGFVDGTVGRLCTVPVALASLPPGGEDGSIFSGAASVALFLHEATRLRGDRDLARLAGAWCDLASVWAVAMRRLAGESGFPCVEA